MSHFLHMILCFLAIISNGINDDMIKTPHGIRPRQCVHKLEANDGIIDVSGNDGVFVYYKSLNKTTHHPRLQECVTNAHELKSNMMSGKGSNGDNGGWEIWGGYYTPSLMGVFNATYILPDTDPSNEDQILYYFVGLQDNSDNNLTIIQPVVAWCPGGCGWNYSIGWSMSSWNCCPSGQTWYGNGVALKKSATINTYTISDRSTGNVRIGMEYQGQTANLNLINDYRQYNWGCVTGEFYDWNNCNAFNKSPFIFKDMTLIEGNGNNISPDWKTTNEISNCGASLTYTNDNSEATMIGST